MTTKRAVCATSGRFQTETPTKKYGIDSVEHVLAILKMLRLSSQIDRFQAQVTAVLVPVTAYKDHSQHFPKATYTATIGSMNIITCYAPAKWQT